MPAVRDAAEGAVRDVSEGDAHVAPEGAARDVSEGDAHAAPEGAAHHTAGPPHQGAARTEGDPA
ncbi:hypothetical protein ACGFW5_08760 [Streptomyces sp. NPDC048416]|uniref:hypothetical protein n=1 Tax=Streptomyces sp. NPDC048416 TaxID=3365546 RepID=UPI003717D585